MSFVERLMACWTEPVPDGLAGEAACHAEQLSVNGTPFTRAELVARARTLQAAYSDVRAEILDVVETADHLVVAVLMHVRHTGPLTTTSGVVAPSGRTAAIRTIDILILHDGVVTRITVVPDELSMLTQLGAGHLAGPGR